ncbi:hypothetical protein MAGR_61750 [Mycolicibacterium agri]|uniref:Integrase catalytic domain-containing protein n=1 Tax=Mycolicibacterium agri TaxID=36811 RepID=A0A7I9WAQ5_MYCAG|nr:hypothetical protein MAGR_61750 [Mycolicibacterium agri]
MSRFQFVADHRHAFEVKWLCAVMSIARSSFYAWLAGAAGRAARQAADQVLAERISGVHDEDNTYGAPRITAELNDGVPDSERVNHKRVARVMRGAGIVGYRRRRRVKTTVPDPANQKVPDLLKRDFTAPAINVKYVGDITYLPLASGGNLYLATVIDCCSRRVAGWAIAEHMRTELVEDALKAAARAAGRRGRCNIPCRSRKSLHLKGFREALPLIGSHPVDGWCGVKCRQRVGRIVQRRPQTRDSARPCLLAGRGDLPPGGLPMAGPLQHQTPALPLPSFQPRHLRKDPDTGYAARSCLTTNPVSTTWGQGP